MRSQDIQIPEPCHADWDAMRPEDRGRFCFECSKKVHDLSAMSKDEARDFLRSNACNDICVSFEHRPDGTLVFSERAPRPAPVVPISRLRRPRSVAAAVAGVGMAAALAACAPHGGDPVRTYAAEAPVFQSPSVVIPVAAPEPEAPPPPPTVEPPHDPTAEDEPCDPEASEPPAAEPEYPRVRGRIRRTAGKPIMRVKGEMPAFDDNAL